MARVPSTRRLALTNALGGVVFGAVMTGWRVLEGSDRDPVTLVWTGLASAVFFGGVMFLLLYLGFVRPRQLDPDPPEVVDRRVTASERMWGDGRPLPVWFRRLVWVGAGLLVVLGVLNLVVTLAADTLEPWRLGTSAVLLVLAAGQVVVARRGRTARPPYSTWATGGDG